MSSFRIDRQYVSFVSAEAGSVSLPDEINTAGAAAAAAEKAADPLLRQSAELLAAARRRAEEQAEQILLQARTEADARLQSAEKTAQTLTEEARGSAASIREAARQEGHAEGRRLAKEEADARKRAEAAEFQRLEETLRVQYTSLVDEMQADVIALIINIVKKIINIKLKQEKIFLGLVDSALDQLKQAGSITIHVGSEEYARYFGEEAAERYDLAGRPEITVAEEETFAPGDLVVESEGEMLDYSVGRQIDRIEQAFQAEGS